MTPRVLDLETTIRNGGDDAIGTLRASPFHPDNFIVSGGWLEKSSYQDRYSIEPGIVIPTPPKSTLLIGHNLKFDLLHLLTNSVKWREWVKYGQIWDTQLVEFVITGHQATYASLDECSLKYGGTLKPDVIKAYWEAGIDTVDIPKEELLEYMEGDVRNTEQVFREQFKIASKLDMLPVLKADMESLLATTMIEYNGMKFDYEYAQTEIKRLAIESKVLIDKITEEMKKHFVEEFWTEVNPGSGDQLSLCLFGGTYKYVKYVEQYNDDGNIVTYKTKTAKKYGQVKLKKTEVEQTTLGLALLPEPNWTTKKAGIYQTNEGVLKVINSSFSELLLKNREVEKDLTTYFIGYSSLMWPTDQCIHGSIGHVVAATARNNSSKPNLQNLSK